MSNLTVDDQLLQRTSEVAAAQGKTVEQFVAEALQQALDRIALRRVFRNGVPTIVSDGTLLPIDPAKVRQAIEEEGF